MKRVKAFTTMVLFSLAIMLLSGVVQAEPKVAGYWIGVKYTYDSKKKEPVPSVGADIHVKNIPGDDDAEVTNITCSSKWLKATMEPYATDVENGESIVVFFGNGKLGEIGAKDFTVKFDVEEDFESEKTWHMKATCSFKDHKPFKKLTVGGKNALSSAKANMYYAKMKIAGKKASVKYKLNNGYKFYGMKLYRGKKTLKVKKSTKLKKGDCLVISTYSKKYTTKGGGDDFAIIVK